MQGATHFIEVYRVTTGYVSRTTIISIEHLYECLHDTKQQGFKTIAVWKIKYKDKTEIQNIGNN